MRICLNLYFCIEFKFKRIINYIEVLSEQVMLSWLILVFYIIELKYVVLLIGKNVFLDFN